MSRESSPIKIVEGSTRKLVEATLFAGLSEQNIQDHAGKWVPLLEQANQQAIKYGHRSFF